MVLFKVHFLLQQTLRCGHVDPHALPHVPVLELGFGQRLDQEQHIAQAVALVDHRVQRLVEIGQLGLRQPRSVAAVVVREGHDALVAPERRDKHALLRVAPLRRALGPQLHTQRLDVVAVHRPLEIRDGLGGRGAEELAVDAEQQPGVGVLQLLGARQRPGLPRVVAVPQLARADAAILQHADREAVEPRLDDRAPR